jgi:5-(carboxyamino)imidazole ribonucleotide synthase
MTALAATAMGVGVRFLVPRPEGSVAPFADVTVADWEDPHVLRAFAARCDAITVESEWAPADLLAEILPGNTTLWPHPKTLTVIRDKGRQKEVLAAAGLPVPDFAVCATLDEALTAAERLGYPVMLKQPRGSYDGYGNMSARQPGEVKRGWEELGQEHGLLVEAWVPFRRELTALIARAPTGEHVTYPVAYTEQRDHRCHAVLVPAGVEPEVEAEAVRVGLAAVRAVEGVGVTAVELFETEDGGILINEMAPRPHNTGHYSIEACHTSQFENHVRAVLGMPLGDPSLRVPVACMVNILGHRSGTPGSDGVDAARAFAGVSVHLYGKDEVRPRRKMGHVTATGSNPDEVRARAEHAASLIHL